MTAPPTTKPIPTSTPTTARKPAFTRSAKLRANCLLVCVSVPGRTAASCAATAPESAPGCRSSRKKLVSPSIPYRCPRIGRIQEGRLEDAVASAVDADDVQRASEDVESVADTDARVLRQHPIDVDPAGWNRVRAVPHPQRHREDVIGVAVQVEGDVSRVDRDRSAHAR